MNHEEITLEDLRTLFQSASNSIYFLPHEMVDRVFGFPLEQFAALGTLVKRNVSLRCQLPISKKYLPNAWMYKDLLSLLAYELSTEEVVRLLRHTASFRSFGWHVRLTTHPSLPAICCMTDLEHVVLDNYVDRYLEIGSQAYTQIVDSEGERLGILRNHIVNHWIAASETKEFVQFYQLVADHLPPTGGQEEEKVANSGTPTPLAGRILTVSQAFWQPFLEDLKSKPELMHSLSPRKFEEMVADLLERRGLDVTLTPASRDGGRDILAYADTAVGRNLYLVECKRYAPERPVGVAVVRALYGVVVNERATAGLVVTTSNFTKGARALADSVKYQMKLKDFQGLRAWVRST